MGRRIINFDSIPSTHAYAMENGATLPDGTVVTAKHQSRGRGRLGREWLSPRGESLLFSLVLKPGIGPAEAALATPVLATAVAGFLRGIGIHATIRWPNDVLVGNAKIAGILAEARVSGEELLFLAASAGINVKQDRESLSEIGRPATSIFAEKGSIEEPGAVLDGILSGFDALYSAFVKGGFAAVAGAWRGLMELEGERIALDLGGRIVQGRVLAFGDDGSIELEESSGGISRHLAGEVMRLFTKAEEEGI